MNSFADGKYLEILKYWYRYIDSLTLFDCAKNSSIEFIEFIFENTTSLYNHHFISHMLDRADMNILKLIFKNFSIDKINFFRTVVFRKNKQQNGKGAKPQYTIK